MGSVAILLTQMSKFEIPVILVVSQYIISTYTAMISHAKFQEAFIIPMGVSWVCESNDPSLLYNGYLWNIY